MATVPRWQQPLVERANRADATLVSVLWAPGGGSGAFAAAAAADRELSELCREFAGRSSSPLLQQLLQHGARALAAQADTLQAMTVTDGLVDDEAVWSDLPEYDEDDVGQALVEPTPEPAVISGDAPSNAAAEEPSQASLDDRAVIAQALADAAGGTVVHRGEVYAPAPEQPQASLEESPQHAHTGGAAGGPGENAAHCACGVVFDGFDTQDAALDVLHEHVEIERLIGEVSEFGDHMTERALSVSGAWSAVANQLDGLLAALPARLRIAWKDECGEELNVDLGVDDAVPRKFIDRLRLARGNADVLAAAYQRAAAKASVKTSETRLTLRGEL